MEFDKSSFKKGMRDSIPIALAYFTVSFSLGIIAKEAGLTFFQSVLSSALLNASAGEYVAFNAIKENAPYIEALVLILIANARYILMSLALVQKIHPKTSLIHRFILGYFITDEYFSLALTAKDYVNPYYSYGAITIASPSWAIGTGLGLLFGNILPAKIVKALSIALYCMFIAIVIPKGKEDKTVGLAIIVTFVLSYVLSFINISSGLRAIIVTMIISTIFAIVVPRGNYE